MSYNVDIIDFYNDQQTKFNYLTSTRDNESVKLINIMELIFYNI